MTATALAVEEHRLIVACVRRGLAHRVAEALHRDLGIDSFHYGHGRGAGMLRAVHARDMIEVDTLYVVVPLERCDEVFGFIYEAAEMHEPGGGIMFQAELSRAAALGLPLPPDDAELEPGDAGDTAPLSE